VRRGVSWRSTRRARVGAVALVLAALIVSLAAASASPRAPSASRASVVVVPLQYRPLSLAIDASKGRAIVAMAAPSGTRSFAAVFDIRAPRAVAVAVTPLSALNPLAIVAGAGRAFVIGDGAGGEIDAVDTGTGALVWAAPVGQSAPVDAALDAPANRLYVALSTPLGPSVRAYDTRSGREVVRRALPVGQTPWGEPDVPGLSLVGLDAPRHRLVLAYGGARHGGPDGRGSVALHILDARTLAPIGPPIAAAPTGRPLAAAAALVDVPDGRLVVVTPAGRLALRSTETGRAVSLSGAGAASRLVRPLLVSDARGGPVALLSAAPGDRLVALDARAGRVVFARAAPGTADRGTIWEPLTLAVDASRGRVYAAFLVVSHSATTPWRVRLIAAALRGGGRAAVLDIPPSLAFVTAMAVDRASGRVILVGPTVPSLQTPAPTTRNPSPWDRVLRWLGVNLTSSGSAPHAGEVVVVDPGSAPAR